MRLIWPWVLLLAVWFVAESPAAERGDTVPRVLTRVEPEYPPSLRAMRVIGRVRLNCVVDESGRPTQIMVLAASQPEFGAAAKKALESWRYTPGRRNGQPQPMRIGVEMEFTFTDETLARMEAERSAEILPAGPPVCAPFELSQMPELEKDLRPRLPKEVARNGLVENAVVKFIVDEAGQPRDVHLLVTTSAACGPEALALVRRWKFKPGKKDGQVVRVGLEVPISFFPNPGWTSGARVKPGVSRDLVTQLNGQPIEVFTGKLDEEQPVPVKKAELDYPNPAGRDIEVVFLECIINPAGLVTHLRALDTENQYLAIQAERSFSQWRFTPPKKNGQPVFYRGRMRAEFRVIH